MTVHACETCARPLPDRTGKRGRPATYCPRKDDKGLPTKAPCQDLSTLMRRVQTHVDRVIDRLPRDEDGRVTEEGRRAAMDLRRQLWSMGNGAVNRIGRLPKVAPPTTHRRDGWKGLRPEEDPEESLEEDDSSTQDDTDTPTE